MAQIRERATVKIVDGPSLMSMMLSLFQEHQDERQSVEFTTGDPGFRVHRRIAINGMEREDGSGFSWIFKGYQLGNNQLSPVKGYYDSRHRTGHIDLNPTD